MLSQSKVEQTEARRDDETARDIRQALKLDNDVPDWKISVEVQGGLVTLEGNVNSMVQKEAAEADAQRVNGVSGVMNNIHVEPPVPGWTPAR